MARIRTKKSATIALPAPPSMGVVRVRERLQRETLDDVIALMRGVLQKAEKELLRPRPDFRVVQEGVTVATTLLDKIIGAPRMPFDEAEAQGTVVIDTQSMLQDAQATIQHLESIPLQKYLEMSTRSVCPVKEPSDDSATHPA